MRWFTLSLVVVCLGCGTDKKDKEDKTAPYGLQERVYNQNCVVETVADDVVTPAATLSATGCYQNVATQTVAPGMIPFDLNVPLWTDGVHKRRFFGIPNDTTIGFTELGAWVFPVGTVLMKEFVLDRITGDASSGAIVETRFLVHAAQDTWRGYSYKWNEARTDAELLDGRETVSYDVVDNGQAKAHAHDFPSRTQCLRCHPVNVAVPLGLQTPQMNRDFNYAEFAEGGATDNQLRALNHVGFFDRDIEAERESLAVLPNPDDTSLSAEVRVRAVMHANCSHCHQPNGSAVSAIIRDLRFEAPLADTYMCDDIVPGQPSASVLWQRIEAVEMPPLGTYELDPRLSLVHDWIADMSSCP